MTTKCPVAMTNTYLDRFMQPLRCSSGSEYSVSLLTLS